MTEQQTSQGDGSAGDAFGHVGQELADAMRREVEELRREMTDRLRGAARGGRSLAAAGALGGIAAAAAGTLPLIALRRLLPSWLLAVLIAGGAGALAVRFARQGLEELGEAAPIDADRVKQAAKDAIHPSP